MNLLAARLMIQSQLHSNGFDPTTYTAFVLDNALADCGEELARKTVCLFRTDTISLATGVSTIAPGSLPTGFRPDRFKTAYLTGSNVHVDAYPSGYYNPDLVEGAPIIPMGIRRRATLINRSFEQLNEQAIFWRDQTGQPSDIAFSTRLGVGAVVPVPDDTYNLTLKWNDLFATAAWRQGTRGAWAVGTQYYPGDIVEAGSSGSVTTGTIYQGTTPNLAVAPSSNTTTWVSLGAGTLTAAAGITINLVDDYLRPVLLYGAPSRLQYNEPGNAYAMNARAQWDAFVLSMKEEGDLGESVIQAEPTARGGGYAFQY